MTFINKLSLGISVNKSGASKIHETGTVPYTGGSSLNPSVVVKTGERTLKQVSTPSRRSK